ncbi:hypothetical protein TGS27_2609 [Geobacillus stearothermophilus]|nr:hypothetical protein TGS27_2609 [Geobacillus stearothermophilus]
MKALEFDVERAYHSLARKENFVTGEVIEMLKHKVSSIPIRGFTKVELFDEKRFGKKVEEVTAENFISINMKDYLEYILIREYSQIGAWSTNSKTYYESNMRPLTSRFFPFDTIALTTDSRPENPQNERVVMGDIVGYAFKNEYVGTDTKRGTINAAESYTNKGIAHFVFDFSTQAANGTFSSVVWYSDTGSPTSISAQRYYQKNYEWYVALKGNNGITSNYDYRGGLCFDGSSFWTMESTGSGAKKIVEVLVTPGTNGKNATFTLGRVWDSHTSSTSDVAYDMTYDSDYIYYTAKYGSLNTIYRVKKSDGTRSTITLSGFRYLYGIERVGAYFYVLGQSATQVNGVYPLRWAKYDSSFNIIEAKNIFDNDVGAYGMAYNQQKNEIAVRTSNGMFIYDLSMNRLSYVISQPNSPESYPGIAVKDGEYFLRDEYSFYMAELGSLGARNLLPTPVTKTSTNTMKVTYDFMFV